MMKNLLKILLTHFMIKEVKMNKDIQKLKKEIINTVMDNMEEKGVDIEEKDVNTIVEMSVNMTLKYVDTQVSTHKFFKDDIK